MRTGDSGPRRLPGPRAQRGVGYIGIVLLVALFTVGLAAAGLLWSTVAQRDREEELLRIGAEFRRAIASYHASSRSGTPAYPSRLEDLLEDRRGPLTRRHLRKIYTDPMTGSEDWGLITTQDGRIRGVFSKSERAPLKTAGFDPGARKFDVAASYADWRFEYVPPTRTGGATR